MLPNLAHPKWSISYAVEAVVTLVHSPRLIRLGTARPCTSSELVYEPGSTVVHLSVETDGKVLATKDCIRRLYDPDVQMLNISEQDMVGKLFFRRGASAPGIIVLGGGEGGLASPMTTAALLASHGYPSLALAYFRFEDLPRNLREIPLEYFEKAIRWLKLHPACNGEVIVYGRSKGAELALLLGTKYPEISGVIASSPSSVACVGDMEPDQNGVYATYSSWSDRGELVPQVPWSDDLCVEATRCLQNGLRIDHVHRTALSQVNSPEEYEIPVEKLRGPVLLISSGDDHWWPATLHCERIKQRLRAHGFPYECIHLDYPDAGHVIRFPGVPTTQLRMNGGTAKANNHASTESWKEVLEFVRRFTSSRSYGVTLN
jgi:dienelactone hydrolase